MARLTTITDEDIKSKLELYSSIKELRQGDLNLYQIARKRGLLTELQLKIEHTDEYLIDWIKQFKRRADIRDADVNKYHMCLRRGLDIYFPPKLTKNGNEIGTFKAKTDALREEKRLLKEAKRLLKESRKVECLDKDEVEPLQRNIFTPIIEDGIFTCGRCLVKGKEASVRNSSICMGCYRVVSYRRKMGVYVNPYNVKDEYCNTVIKHHEKVFNIGIKVDDRMQDYLSKVGYWFMFKEND